MAKIHRFPRELKDYPDAPLTKTMKVTMQLAAKRIPRGYDRLTKKQKRAARLVINGMTVGDACRKVGMDTNTWYRYMHYHPLFKAYYLRTARKAAEEVEGRLEAKMGRAVRIIEESMDSPDYYFAHDVAQKYLTGRGKYKRSIDSKQELTGAVNVRGEIKHINKPMDKDLMIAFIEALGGHLGNNRPIEPKIVKGKTVSKVINALPEPAPNADNTQIPEVDERKAS